MAKIAEILPYIAAGLAGAGSPQGADVFNRFAQTVAQRSREKRQQAESDKRLLLAEDAAGREKERLALTKEQGKSIASLRDMQMERERRLAEEAEQEKRDLEQRRQFILNYIEENPELANPVEKGLIATSRDTDELNTLTKNFTGLTEEQMMERAKSLKEEGMSGTITPQGLMSVNAGRTAEAPDPEKVAAQNMYEAEGLVLESQKDMDAALNAVQEAAEDMDLIMAKSEKFNAEREPGDPAMDMVDGVDPVRAASNKHRAAVQEFERQKAILHHKLKGKLGRKQADEIIAQYPSFTGGSRAGTQRGQGAALAETMFSGE